MSDVPAAAAASSFSDPYDVEVETICSQPCLIYRLTQRWSMAAGLKPLPVCAFLVQSVRHAHEWVLVDAGLDEYGENLAMTVRRLMGFTGELRAVCVSHGHLDHVGGVRSLVTRFTARVVVHAAELPFLTQQRHYGDIPPASKCSAFACCGRKLRELPYPLTEGAVRYVVTNGTRPGGRCDVDNAVLPSDEWEVVYTPGHTPGALSFVHLPSRSVFCGDIVMNLAPILACCCCCRGASLSPAFAMSTPDPKENMLSVRALASSLDERYIVWPGHDFARGVPYGTLVSWLQKQH